MPSNNPAGPPPGTRRPGRPKGSKNKAVADIRALAQSYGPDAVDRLYEIMNNNDAPPASQVAAARELLDRGFGKATQFIANDPDHPVLNLGPKIDWDKMPKEVLEAAYAQIKAGPAPDPLDDEEDDGEA